MTRIVLMQFIAATLLAWAYISEQHIDKEPATILETELPSAHKLQVSHLTIHSKAKNNTSTWQIQYGSANQNTNTWHLQTLYAEQDGQVVQAKKGILVANALLLSGDVAIVQEDWRLNTKKATLLYGDDNKLLFATGNQLLTYHATNIQFSAVGFHMDNKTKQTEFNNVQASYYY